jgi:hypothetical protein
MNILLIFFALPIAVIIISVVLQKLLKSPILVALLVFAIFLIVTFVAYDATFLVETIVYTIIAFITAYLTKIIIAFNENGGSSCTSINNGESDSDSRCNGDVECNNCNEDSLGNEVTTRINVIPNVANNGRTGSVYGCYRRR